MTDPETLLREELKREAAWDPAERWRVIQETITWAEQQAAVQRNTPAECRRLENEKLARWERPSPSTDATSEPSG